MVGIPVWITGCRVAFNFQEQVLLAPILWMKKLGEEG
jgi:hypothetical protein